MRLVILTAGLAMFAAGPAVAINRYNSETMTCAKVQSTIRAEGAAIMRYRSKTSPSLVLYDRYVANANHCAWRETTEYRYIPSKNDPTCRVLACKAFEPKFDFRLKRLLED